MTDLDRARTDDPTPLAEVERAVQERAKAIALDMGTAAGRQALRALIDDELDRWDDDVRRGRRSFTLTNPDLVAERAWRNLAGYGPLAGLLEDPDVWEIEINSPSGEFGTSNPSVWAMSTTLRPRSASRRRMPAPSVVGAGWPVDGGPVGDAALEKFAVGGETVEGVLGLVDGDVEGLGDSACGERPPAELPDLIR